MQIGACFDVSENVASFPENGVLEKTENPL